MKGKRPISPLISPSLLPCVGDDSPRKGFNFERNRLVLVQILSVGRSKREKTREEAGKLVGRMWLRRVPPEREDKWEKCRGF